MDTLLIITILIVIAALAFDFINGFHDTANAIATAVSTRALKPRHAILIAAGMNFVGALLFTGVAKTITGDIVDPFALQDGSIVILSALIAGIFGTCLRGTLVFQVLHHTHLSVQSQVPRSHQVALVF